MTLGCGAVAGNATSDNVGPLNLIDVKRLAYSVREPSEAFEAAIETQAAKPAPSGGVAVNKDEITAAVMRYLAARGVSAPSAPGGPSCCSVPALAPRRPADFVSEADVRAAIAEKRKILAGPETIMTPSARDLAVSAGALEFVKSRELT